MPTRMAIASTVAGLLSNNALRDPGGAALLHGHSAISWARLEELSARVAQGLRDLGVHPGDRVALWLPNVPEWFVLYFACVRLGAVAVAVNTRFRAVEVADIVDRSGAKVLACMPGFRRIDFFSILAEIDPAATDRLAAVVTVGEEAGAAPPALDRLRRVPWRALASRPAYAESHARPDSPCNIFTTSGTTKAPKLVLHRQGSIVAHAYRVARGFGFTAPDTVSLALLPHCGVYGFNQALATFAAGRPLVLQEAFDVEEAVGLVARHKPTTLFGGDDMYARLLDAAPGERPFPSVRWAGYASFNPALADLPRRAEARGLVLCGLYGMSEVQALFAVRKPDDPVERRALAGGHPTSGLATMRARDPESGDLLPFGAPGELEAMGPSLMVGYFGDPEATRQAFTEDGHFRTGDLGYAEADGSFVFLSRMGDTLRLGGFLVNPAEIEARVLEHPAVAEAQAVAVARPEGARAAAFVVLRPGAALDEAGIIEHCRRGLAGFKVPARVFGIDAFPVTPSPNGPKIQRARLRQIAAELMA